MPTLLLNVVPVGSTPDATVTVGLEPYDKARLAALRREHCGTHFFKRGRENGKSILSVALKPDVAALGTRTEEQTLLDAPWLLAPLTVEALVNLFTRLERPMLKWHPLRLLSQRPAYIFAANPQLPDWLLRRIVLGFETRTVRGPSKSLVVVLACGVRTRNIIDADCATMLAAGLPLVGRYVAMRCPVDDPRIHGFLP